ncbi:hypothetical protein M3Y98_00487000 [Aphelenchoides besseyi]|nr:hypothetical protein M3Y98_00487000 [Aphelenchoides besseyi]KAI6207635.1 hypothetical protein M3Y96_00029900 [Aphelenchoides besseyi]
MGRRKQLKPTRLADDDATDASTSSPVPETTSSTPKPPKKTTDFSISAHLRTSPKPSIEETKDNGSTNDTKLENEKNAEFLTAQRAYQTLLSHLKQQEVWMRSMGFNSMSMNPFVGACFPPTDLLSNFTTPRKRSQHKTGADSTAVDLSTKKKRHNSASKTTPEKSTDGNAAKSALERLSSLVTTVGNNPSVLANNMRASLLQSDNSIDPSRVFTCLQCFEQYDSMESLVSHMEQTKHYTQKSVTPSKSPSNDRPVSTTPPDKTSMTGNKNRFSFQCLICDYSSNSSIDQHMSEKHSFKSPSDWINSVKLIPMQ